MTEQVRETGQPARPVTWRSRRWRGLAVAGLIAVAGTLALSALHRPAAQESRFAVVEQTEPSPAAPADPLMAELIRCRALPPQVDDPACREAWDENRRRFFGERRATRVSGDPLPAAAPIPTAGTAPTPTMER